MPFEFSKGFEIPGSNHNASHELTCFNVGVIKNLKFHEISGGAEFVTLSKMRSILWQAVISTMESEVFYIQ